jgi:hypothetical protein
MYNTTYQLYDRDDFALTFPGNTSVTHYPPELDFFLSNSTNSSFFPGNNTMSKNQYTMLFAEDTNSLQTLLSPINLHSFYEWYKKGDFVSIKKRFSYD